MIFLLNPQIFFHFTRQPLIGLNLVHRRGTLEHYRVLWILLPKSRDIIQIAETNLEQKYRFISPKNQIDNIFRKTFFGNFWDFFLKNLKKSRTSENFENFRNFQIFEIFEIFDFRNFRKIFFEKYFQFGFSTRWKNIFAPDFFLWFGLYL